MNKSCLHWRHRLIVSLLSMGTLHSVHADPLTLGVHSFSYHDRGYFNELNPGLYLAKDEYSLGFYKNSINRESFYGAYTLHWGLPPNRFIHAAGISVGVVTGYMKPHYSATPGPLLALSVKHELNREQGLRVSLLPAHKKSPASYVLHMSFEYRLK